MKSEILQSAIVSQDRLLPGLHGLRGIAALAVMLFHLAHLANISVPEPFTFIRSDFGYGVFLFFVLSAFLLMHSTEHTMHRPTWAVEYFVKRFWRIAPLFYCVMAGMLLWPMIKSSSWVLDLQALLLNLTFSFGLAPWKEVVKGGWTVGVEMLFYCIFPILLLTVRTHRATLLLLLLSILVSYGLRWVLHTHYEYTVTQYGRNWSYFSFGPNLCFFAIGIYAYRLTRDMKADSLVMRWVLPVFALILISLLMFVRPGKPLLGPGRPDLILWGIAFGALCMWQSIRPSRWCANRIFEYLGERSYSLYLLHPVVITLLKGPIQAVYGMLVPYLGASSFFVCAALALLPLLALTEVTYQLIEVPCIAYGQRINRRAREGAEQSQPALDNSAVIR